MPQATKSSTPQRLPRVTLNSDGARHPLLNSLSVFTLIAGVAAFALGFFVSQHVIASCLGIAALGVGLYAQMVSATREERMIIVTGLVGGFVGLALGLGHGGFHP